jgi:hypothetical protein
MRKSFDVARRQMKLPDTIELLKRETTAGPDKGKYASLYTINKGWLLYYFNETVDGNNQRLAALVFTDDRDDFDDETLRLLIAAKVVINGRTIVFKKNVVRPALSADPAYFQIILDPTGEIST